MIPAALGTGCKPISQPPVSLTDTLLSIRAPSVCNQLMGGLSPLHPPFQIPSGQSYEPFSPEVQEWLKKHLVPEGVYAPVGRWQAFPEKSLWIIERISADGTRFYGILADSSCMILDTLCIAYQIIQTDFMEEARSFIERDGRALMRIETRTTEFVEDEPRTTTRTREVSYQVDWATGKLRPL